VLAPTRELCTQIEDTLKGLLRGLPHARTALVMGGMPAPPQLHRLRQAVQVVVATPGRLDALRRAHDDIAAQLANVSLVVLDEVDDMLADGLEREVRPPQRLAPRHRAATHRSI